jgi:anti-sigma-K factor RskA
MRGQTDARASRYAITIERKGGSPTPQGPFVATSDFAKA